MTKPTHSKSSLLDDFLGEYVIIFMGGLNTTVPTEDGGQAEIPMVVEGLFREYDENYILIGNEEDTVYSLLSRPEVIKIDIGETMVIDPNIPQKSSMN